MFLDINKIKEIACYQHKKVNQTYGDHPYSFHLEKVEFYAKKYSYLLNNEMEINLAYAGCWCHDLIEDARLTYNNVKEFTNVQVAEIVMCVTSNVRGRTRDERMPDWVYNEISKNKIAKFVKLCDRLANVSNSFEEGHSMFKTYKKEHEHFKKMLKTTNDEYQHMWDELDKIFNLK